MKRIFILILQATIIFIGVSVLALMLIEPHFEGRNVNSTLFEVYFKDPFLAYVYASSILFFITLYQGFKFLGQIGQSGTVSPGSIKSLRTIRYCTSILIFLILGALAYFFIVQSGTEDIAGGVAIGLAMIFILLIVTVIVGLFERKFSHI